MGQKDGRRDGGMGRLREAGRVRAKEVRRDGDDGREGGMEREVRKRFKDGGK